MDPLIGQIILFAGNFAPRGWAFCNGQLLSIAQNTALFSLLGTTYGGDGRTTFALPDLRGRVPMHAGNGPGLSYRNLGETGGTETNTLTVNQMPSHSHGLRAATEGFTDEPTNNFIANGGINGFAGVSDTAMSPQAVQPAGGGQPVNNVQPFTVVNYIIALTGIYPSRQ